MSFVQIDNVEPGIGRITLQRPRVNAINAAVIQELQAALKQLNADEETRAIVLTGYGAFFSFGLDVPEIFPLSPSDFTAFLHEFAGLYREIYASPKPVVAALNGHTTAGGCMLAIACDQRVMAQGRAKIGLNEVRFGAGLFAGSSILLQQLVGHRLADKVAQLGAFYEADAAAELGLVDIACPAEDVPARAVELARAYLATDAAALAQIRSVVRGPVLAEIDAQESDSIRSFVDLWYSPSTRAQTEKIIIRKGS